MTLGPLEYILVGFEGNHFTGQILPEIRAACDKGIIRVIDLLLILKDEQGNTAVMEWSDLSSEQLEQLGPIAADMVEVLAQDDVEAIAHLIPNNSSAALLLIEQSWAVGLKVAIMNAGGIPLAGGLIAPAVTQMIEADLAAVAANKNQAAVKAAE